MYCSQGDRDLLWGSRTNQRYVTQELMRLLKILGRARFPKHFFIYSVVCNLCFYLFSPGSLFESMDSVRSGLSIKLMQVQVYIPFTRALIIIQKGINLQKSMNYSWWKLCEKWLSFETVKLCFLLPVCPSLYSIPCFNHVPGGTDAWSSLCDISYCWTRSRSSGQWFDSDMIQLFALLHSKMDS